MFHATIISSNSLTTYLRFYAALSVIKQFEAIGHVIKGHTRGTLFWLYLTSRLR